MPRPRGRSDPEATRQKILTTAEARFANEGFHGASLASIAEDAGITAPSLLHHFPDKQTLFDEVLRKSWSRLADAILPALAAGGSADEIVERLIMVIALIDEAEPSLTTQISEAFLSGRDLGEQAVNDTFFPLLREVEEAIRSAPPQAIHPDAPLFETIVYVVIARAARHRVARVSPAVGASVANNEGFLVAAMMDAIQVWPDAV